LCLPNIWNPVEVERVDSWVPYGLKTTDGVRWYSREGWGGAPVSTPSWKSLALQGTWVPYQSPPAKPGYLSAQYLRTSAGIVMMRGLVKLGGSGTVICTLPAGYRPSGRLAFLGSDSNNGGGSYLQVRENGDVVWVTNVTGSSIWVNLEDIMFPAADVAPNSAWTPITMGSDWESYRVVDTSWPVPAWWQDSTGRVWFRGLVKTKTGVNPGGDSTIGIYPVGLKPNLQIHQAVLSSGAALYSSIHYRDNIIVWKPESPASSTQWLSLCNIRLFPVANFPESVWTNMTLIGTTTNYAPSSFPAASIIRMPDGIIHCRGLISNAQMGAGTAFTAGMAIGDRNGDYQMIWSTVSNSTFARINYNSSNHPNPHALAKLSGNNAWQSLDGIQWFDEG
ncbi:MAG TPA: hypothetical protein VFT74_18735, partial [Isosphaeraceae bacterium]|nr:hypothetical protein [Isosphaeraceae bacterium]